MPKEDLRKSISIPLIEQSLTKLYTEYFGKAPTKLTPLPPSGSHRIYYRLSDSQQSAIGAYNPDSNENEAFIGFSKHFRNNGLPVPEVYNRDRSMKTYLQEDLGDNALYHLLPEPGQPFGKKVIRLYEKSVEALARLQIKGGEELDYNLCYPRASFDKQSMLWDFNTFKYYFLKLAAIPFDEQKLEDELYQLADYLLEADTSHFMFRDFQSRNILIKDEQPYFIDYQGGRKGALQYDLASLLYQAKANMPEALRQQLLEHYLDTATQYTSIDREKFTEYFYGYVFMRTIQVLGTYGYRGLYERKTHFLKSIPFALQNAKWLLDNQKLKLELPILRESFKQLIASDRFQAFDKEKGRQSPLRIKVQSFSYKIGGIPKDDTDNGGGFVFDCRFIHNPGRYQPYKKLTGRDEAVKDFLRHRSQMNAFLEDAYRIVEEAVENYIERDFSSLMVSFGCTGGQHRSVFAADAMAKHLEDKYGVDVVLHHIEQEKKNWIN